MFTSAVGFGEHHFLWVDKSQCPPYEKSLIVYCCSCSVFIVFDVNQKLKMIIITGQTLFIEFYE
jgi:hypothetical protein